MKKLHFSIFSIFFAIATLYAQIVIKGKVVFENEGINDASVYLNGTTYSTYTNEKGEFQLDIASGKYQIIVSALGYESMVYDLQTESYSKPLLFELKEDVQYLDEVVVTSQPEKDENRPYHLALFKKELIGKNEFASQCKILNPKVLSFRFDTDHLVFTAKAKAPIKIKNNALGYVIEYDLNEFIIENNIVRYDGYFYFKPMEKSKISKKWQKNRRMAYNGSPVHFFQSLFTHTTYQDGFTIDLYFREKNKNRPTEEQIAKARELIRFSNSPILLQQKILQPKNALDSAMMVLQNSRLPEFVDVLQKANITPDAIYKSQNDIGLLQFDGFLTVAYLKEKPEENYLNQFRQVPKPKYQISNIIPQSMPIKVFPEGILENPGDVIFEGYWAFEKLANWLPLNYKPDE